MTEVSEGSTAGNKSTEMDSNGGDHNTDEMQEMDIKEVISENEVLKVQNETMKAKQSFLKAV